MFRVKELLKATGGRLIKQVKDTRIKGISIDSRTLKRGEAFIAIKGNNFNGHDFIEQAIEREASCVITLSQKVASKAKGVTCIVVEDTVRALGDIARFYRRRFDIPVIAVTGSNGKTTTKEMVAQVLSKKFKVLKNEGTKNNQIGLPLTLLKLKTSDEVVILELGTNHPGEIEYLTQVCQPNIGIVTNIGPAHLEFLYNLNGVFKEKYTLIDNLNKPYIAILNADDKWLKNPVYRKAKRPVVFGFGMLNNTDFFASGIKLKAGKLEFYVTAKPKQKYKLTLKTLGLHNIYNALAAIAVGHIFGIGYKQIAAGLESFNFPSNRLKVTKLNQIKFIDDTYNSNPVSLKEALNTLDNFKVSGRKIFIMGDMLELGKRKELFHYQAGRDAAGVCDTFISVGKLSRLAAQAARACGLSTKNIFTCRNSHQARDILFKRIFPNKKDIVLVKGSRLMQMEKVFKKP